LVVPLVLSLLAACGSDPAEEPVSPPAPPASVPALPDGTVPWLDLPVEQDAFDAATPQRRAVPKGAKACRADQLTASMPKWFQKGDGYEAEGIRPDMALGMFGVVEVRNRSSAACTLQGEVPVRLLVEGRPAAVRSDHGINEEAERRVTAVPPGEGATLRVDWSAPFCGEAAGRQELELTLPDDGGTLLAAVAEPAHPVCSSSETHPELRSVLSSSAFDELRLPSTRAAGFDPLRVTAEAPKEAASGRDLRYVVTLENPTDADIRLDPCPGYAEERFSTGDATVQAVNERSTYRLNCRTVAAVPAHGSVRFEMRSRVPAIEAGRSLAVAWRLLAPGYGSDGTGFTLTVR
jgi:hypothetical protein